MVQLFASWAVTVYEPAARAPNVPEAPNVTPSIAYEYGAVEPEASTVTEPVAAPLQSASV